MHPTAILGFHAPRVAAVGGGNFDSADLNDAYSRAVEQIGKRLMAAARYRDEAWSNPMIKPGLINEMLIRNGNNFYYIDTIGKAAEFEIDLYDAISPKKSSSKNRANACANAIAAITDATVAADARRFWLTGQDHKKIDPEAGEAVYSFEANRFKGRYCDLVPSEDADSEITLGVGGAKQKLSVPGWFFWPSDKKLSSVPTKAHRKD